MTTDIQAVAIARLKVLGWDFDRIVTTAATKDYNTAVGVKAAIVRIRRDSELPQHWLNAEYQSEGSNAVANCIGFLPDAIGAELVEAKVDHFIASVERAIANTYAVRLLNS